MLKLRTVPATDEYSKRHRVGSEMNWAIALRGLAFVAAVFSVAMGSSCSSAEYDGEPKRNIVVLSGEAVVLTKRPIVLSPPGITEVSGALTSVCFVIKDGLRLQDMNSMQKVFSDAMGGVEIAVTLGLSSGSSIALSKPTYSWSEDGVILKHGELAACSSPPCGVTLPLGAKVKSVAVAATPEFGVKGIYWESGKDPSEPSAPSTRSLPNSKSISVTGCARS
jgi:hypothetical protein